MLQFYKWKKGIYCIAQGSYLGKEAEAVHLKLTQYSKSTIVKFFKKHPIFFRILDYFFSSAKKKKKQS